MHVTARGNMEEKLQRILFVLLISLSRKLSTTLQSFSFNFCFFWGKFQPWLYWNEPTQNPKTYLFTNN